MIRSPPVSVAVTRAQTRGRGAAGLAIGAGAASVVLSAWLILGDRPVYGGAAALAASVLLFAGGLLGRRDGSVRLRMIHSFADRTFDGCVLGAMAWATRESDPAASIGALLVLGLEFLAAYVRARGRSLEYRIEDGPAARHLRSDLVAVGLLAGLTVAGLYAAAVLAGLAVLVRASQVAKEERAA